MNVYWIHLAHDHTELDFVNMVKKLHVPQPGNKLFSYLRMTHMARISLKEIRAYFIF
jgi:hypothetical protein